MSSLRLRRGFEFSLDQQVVEGCVALGYFEDPRRLTLAFANGSDNVVILSPNHAFAESAGGGMVDRKLAVNRKITALRAARLSVVSEEKEDKGKDALLVGTATNLLAYDVRTNSDLFYKDVPDGVHCVLCDSLHGTQCAIVGGNCSVQAFDASGDECFWTVASGDVRCLALCDVDENGTRDLVIGTDDAKIVALRNEDVLHELTVSGAVTHLLEMQPACFAFALRDGTLGYFRAGKRVWKDKEEGRVTSMAQYWREDDMHVVCGWDTGLVQIRELGKGRVVWDTRSEDRRDGIAAVAVGDIRGHGNRQLVTVTSQGNITAWVVDDTREEKEEKRTKGRFAFGSRKKSKKEEELVSEEEMRSLRELQQENERLEGELHHLTKNLEVLKSGDLDDPGLIPTNTEIFCTLSPSKEQHSLVLLMTTNNDTVIKMAIIYGTAVFEGGSFVVSAENPSTSLELPLKFEKDLECNLSIKAVVGHLSSKQDHVFQLSHRIPKFASYLYVPIKQMQCFPESYCTFQVPARAQRVATWMNQAFLLEYEGKPNASVHIGFLSLRTGGHVVLKCSPEGDMEVRTDDMELAGNIVQDLCEFLGVSELSSFAVFPGVFSDAERLFADVREYSEIRKHLAVDISGSTELLKEHFVRVEDGRELRDWQGFRRDFAELCALNQEMLREFQKREGNHRNLLGALRRVNQTISHAARLRLGPFQSQTVTGCRKAVKTQNASLLVNVIQNGKLVI